MVHINNSFALVGDKMSEMEFALFILRGLGTDYDPLVMAILTRSGDEASFVDDIQGLLLNHEIRSNKHVKLSLENPLSENYVSKKRYNYGSSNSFTSNKFIPNVQKTEFKDNSM